MSEEKPPLALSDKHYIKLYGAFWVELTTKKEHWNLYEAHIWNMLVEISEVIQRYVGEEGLAGKVSNRENVYNANFVYPTIRQDTSKDTFKRKVKNGTKKVRQFLGI